MQGGNSMKEKLSADEKLLFFYAFLCFTGCIILSVLAILVLWESLFFSPPYIACILFVAAVFSLRYSYHFVYRAGELKGKRKNQS